MKYLHSFLNCRCLTIRDLWRIKIHFKSFENAYLNRNWKEFVYAGVDPTKIEFIGNHFRDFDEERSLGQLKQQGIELICINDILYPDCLKNIYLAPLGLYIRGNKEVLRDSNDFFAVVGPRMVSNYGEIIAEVFCDCLASNGLVLVSGLARGVDSIAHKKALEKGNRTIAVLGCSINSIYPVSNTKLAEDILKSSGLIISESPPNMPITKFNFAQRNRIISGISRGVLIVEAGKRSGGLITARHGFNQNRPVFTVPNSIFEECSLGTNKLIAEKIAHPVFSPYEILEELDIYKHKKKKIRKSEKLELNREEEMVFKNLSLNSRELWEIKNKCNLSLKELLIALSNLELRGLVKNIGQSCYAKIKRPEIG